MTETTKYHDNSETGTLELRAELELGIPPDSTCPLFNNVQGEIDSVTLFPYSGVCFIDVTVSNDEQQDTESLRLAQEIDNCSCPAFWSHGCTPNVLRIEGDTAISEVYVPNRKVLKEIVADIRETGRSVKLRKLTPVEQSGERSEPRWFETAQLTDKERAAVEQAVARGYYETPRRVSLEELATEFGITKQSFSTRLQSAESKMVTGIFDDAE
ncbi:helix-turn-helix domain-containing protein [Haloferax sp. YSSS75]|uniref:helix-turn-helix domain-containing protein n=1 Tax=Haloferax sp. YSSS75 TaxID=3388564 RepID=UPI00398C86B5